MPLGLSNRALTCSAGSLPAQTGTRRVARRRSCPRAFVARARGEQILGTPHKANQKPHKGASICSGRRTLLEPSLYKKPHTALLRDWRGVLFGKTRLETKAYCSRALLEFWPLFPKPFSPFLSHPTLRLFADPDSAFLMLHIIHQYTFV